MSVDAEKVFNRIQHSFMAKQTNKTNNLLAK